ncbi:hypothetical protein PR202_gn00772 [Eleusine coracana subsp. coracana]|uniref:UTP25 NTP hydrolase-like domain-containing protein n=1 Tax=Eleusine coracana subsp. coracana TaxID=191504 RepID=A0AAV5G533_ELECO|nr:hypothetical protein PR202_gn00772 [Eleusine coracana subsp. coracana]
MIYDVSRPHVMDVIVDGEAQASKCRRRSTEALVTESRTVDVVQGIEHSDEDDTEDVMDDTINHERGFDETETLCNSYHDIMYCNKKPFYLKGKGVDSSTMDAYLMHALNHIHRTRDIVIRNDSKLRNDDNRGMFDDNSYLDQGFTRPKDNTIGLFKKQCGESDDELEKQEQSTKPADFDHLFAGDIDDHFVY